MATSKIYHRLIKKLTATAAFGLLTATSQAGLFCDWNMDHKRPYCSPACEQGWGYHDTCWRQFPPTEPCSDWGAHCSANTMSNGFNYGEGVNPGLNAAGPYSSVPMVPQIQQPMMLQQPMTGQNYQMQGAPMMYGAQQGAINSYNANPAPVPPAGQMNQQPIGPRTFGPANPSGQQPTSQMPAGQPSQNGGRGGTASGGGFGGGQSQDDDQLQLPGLEDDVNDFDLPAIPDLSRASTYYNQGSQYNQGVAGQGYGNQYQSVSQANNVNGYQQPLLYPNGNSAAAYGGVANQQQYGQPQQGYAQPMMPNYQQQGGQFQPPQTGNYSSQPRSIQVAPGRQPSVVGVSFSRSIRPASNNMNMQQPMPVQKQSFLSKINPFSK